MTNSMILNAQWATRPDDQRFTTLEQLHAATLRRKTSSHTQQVRIDEMRAMASQDNDISLGYAGINGQLEVAKPTHWSFNQIAAVTGAPTSWMRKVPAELAAINLQYGLERLASREEGLLLIDDERQELRAVTSTTYGRIWDHELVEAVMDLNEAHGGRWKIPAASYAATNPKRASTLYASDRDVWLFLVDDQHPIEVNGEVLFRAFAASNSEVGGGTMWLTTLLYRRICDNRIIWGVEDQRELSIKHTRNAPERFRDEVGPALKAYSEASDRGVIEMVKKAQEIRISKDSDKDAVQTWLRARGFTASVSKAIETAAVVEEGEAATLWDIVQGTTAHARSLQYQDERVALELKAAKLLGNLN